MRLSYGRRKLRMGAHGASHFRATGKSHTSIATCSFYLTLTESASRLLRFIVFAAQLICQSIRHRVGLHPHLQPGRS